jgi:hypothetical protein
MKNPFACTAFVYFIFLCLFFLSYKSGRLSAGSLPKDRSAAPDSDFQCIQAQCGKALMLSLRNESRKETEAILSRAERMGGFPDWMLEYGMNLMLSCEKNAILFTGSLIDTNSAWYMQCVRRIRPDVAVIPMGMLDRLWLVDYWNRKYNLDLADPNLAERVSQTPLEILVCSDASYRQQNVRVFLDIVGKNIPKRPVYFSMDVNPNFLKSVRDHLEIRGCLLKLHPEPLGNSGGFLNVDGTEALFLKDGGFSAIENRVGPDYPEIEAIARHYRFAARMLMGHYQSTADVRKGSCLDRLIRDAFKTGFVSIPESVEFPGR